MLLKLILCSILFTPAIYGSNSTLEKSEHTSNIILSKESNQGNKTKLTVVSEGGSVISDSVPLTLSTKKHILLNLDKELGKNKEKPVVPRKGAIYDPLDDNNSIKINFSEPEVPKDKSNSKVSDELKDKNVNTVIKHDFNKTFIYGSSSSSAKENKTEMHKKPLLLSYEALEKMDKDVKNNDHLQIPAMKSSSKSLVSDQMPSPNKENGPSLHSVNKNRHPGMIMPIVITILVVPMFAILGYMALKRGQEAWKNRHYKRMDFLLDGMYND